MSLSVHKYGTRSYVFMIPEVALPANLPPVLLSSSKYLFSSALFLLTKCVQRQMSGILRGRV